MTEVIKSKGVVIDIIEKKGKTLVCFSSHDGVFKLPPGNEVFFDKVSQSCAKSKEISFSFDREMNLVEIE